MMSLPVLSIILGLLVIAGRLPGLVWPDKFRPRALAFPRSVFWGRLLMGIAAAIAWVIVFNAARLAAAEERFLPMPRSALGGLIHLLFLNGPVIVLVGFPLAYWLVWQYGKHFLAMRGAAALMLLAARYIVEVTDRSDHPARLIVTTLAYLWVIAAIWMASAPHHIRDVLQFLMANNARCRLACGAGVVLGLGLVLLGIVVY